MRYSINIITSTTNQFLPFSRQILNFITIEGLVLGRQEILQPLIQVTIVGEVSVVQEAAQELEQMNVGEGKVCFVRCMDKHFTSLLEQTLADDVFEETSGVVVEEAHFAVLHGKRSI